MNLQAKARPASSPTHFAIEFSCADQTLELHRGTLEVGPRPLQVQKLGDVVHEGVPSSGKDVHLLLSATFVRVASETGSAKRPPYDISSRADIDAQREERVPHGCWRGEGDAGLSDCSRARGTRVSYTEEAPQDVLAGWMCWLNGWMCWLAGSAGWMGVLAGSEGPAAKSCRSQYGEKAMVLGTDGR